MDNIDLVTGGSGFVGTALTRVLLESGRRVRILDMKAPDGINNVEFVAGSVTDQSTVSDALAGASRVFHLAGIADLWHKNPSMFDDVNYRGTVTVFKAAKRAGVETFVFCSSATTLVSSKTPLGSGTVDEEVSWLPEQLLGAYPASKRRAEIDIIKLASEVGVACPRTVIVNPTEPLGAGDKTLTPPTKMMIDVLNGKLPAYLDCVLNFMPVRDFALGLVAAAEAGRDQEHYILSGEDIRLPDLLLLLSQLTGKPVPQTKIPYPLALMVGAVDTSISRVSGRPPKAPLTGVRLAGRRVHFSNEKARRELAWQPGRLRPALEEMLSWANREGLFK
ncbi:MAG: NAD-dependent epimerase/dehydratase family protein [Pseudomonadota bacterium]